MKYSTLVWPRDVLYSMFRQGKFPNILIILNVLYTNFDIPAWASGSERNTLVFHMLGVTGSGPQFRKSENFRKGRLDVQAHAQ